MQLQPSESTSDLKQRFREAGARYAALAAEEGIRVVPYHSEDLPYFSRHPTAVQEAVVGWVNLQIRLIEEVRNEGHRATNTAQLLWKALRAYGLLPQSDLFAHITEEDVINVYDAGQNFLFVNLQGFNFFSLTLEQLMCRPWFEVTRRDPAITEALYKIGIDLAEGRLQSTVVPDVPEHLFEEIDSAEGLQEMITIKCISPLTRDGRYAGGVTVNQCRIIGRKSAPVG